MQPNRLLADLRRSLCVICTDARREDEPGKSRDGRKPHRNGCNDNHSRDENRATASTNLAGERHADPGGRVDRRGCIYHRDILFTAFLPRMTDGNDSLWLHEYIPYKLSVVANRLSQSIGGLFEQRFGIQIPEWRILMALYAHGPMAPNGVVEQTSMDKARVSRAQRRMVELELLAVSEDPRDRRRLVLFLTKKGEALCRSIIPAVRDMEAWFLTVLEPEERRILDRALTRLLERSQELRNGLQPIVEEVTNTERPEEV